MDNNNFYNVPNNYVMGMFDDNGKPLKNRFGMKLIFSILEMVTLLLCNLPGFILGLVACIFTCKANASYKSGDKYAFKSAAKTSAICLWIGLAEFVLVAIISAVLVSSDILTYNFTVGDKTYTNKEVNEKNGNHDDDNFDYNYREDNSENEDETEDEIVVDTELEDDTELIDDYENDYVLRDPVDLGNYYQFSYAGKSVSLPVSITELQTVFTISEDDLLLTVDPDSYEMINIYDDTDLVIGYVKAYNNSNSVITVHEAVVKSITFMNETWGEYIPPIEILNGVTFAYTQEEVLAALPIPSYESYISSEQDELKTEYYSWEPIGAIGYSDGISIYFLNNVPQSISIEYSGE